MVANLQVGARDFSWRKQWLGIVLHWGPCPPKTLTPNLQTFPKGKLAAPTEIVVTWRKRYITEQKSYEQPCETDKNNIKSLYHVVQVGDEARKEEVRKGTQSGFANHHLNLTGLQEILGTQAGYMQISKVTSIVALRWRYSSRCQPSFSVCTFTRGWKQFLLQSVCIKNVKALLDKC